MNEIYIENVSDILKVGNNVLPKVGDEITINIANEIYINIKNTGGFYDVDVTKDENFINKERTILSFVNSVSPLPIIKSYFKDAYL